MDSSPFETLNAGEAVTRDGWLKGKRIKSLDVANPPLTLCQSMKTCPLHPPTPHQRAASLHARLPRTDPASGSRRCPWWSWDFPWPRWSRSLWYRTDRGYRCRSGSTPALPRIPASHQCWQCVNPIRKQGKRLRGVIAGGREVTD